MATLGISVLPTPAPYSNPVHSSSQCHPLSGYQIAHHHSAVSSPLPRPRSPAVLERGEARSCTAVQRPASHRDAKVLMSHNPSSLSSSSSEDILPAPTRTTAASASASAEATRSPIDKKRKASVEDEPPETQESGRSRPASWHPSAPVEPPLEPTQLPPIAVPSILNPAKRAVPNDSRDALGMQHASASPRPHLAHPSSTHPAKRLSLSPGLRQRPLVTPVSPSARFVSTAGSYHGRTNSSHHTPLAHESRPGMYSTPGSPLPMDPVVVPSTSSLAGGVPASASVHSTPTFHSRRTSAGPTPNPSPKETSPTTPQSAYSHFGRSSPALASMSGPQPMPSMVHSSPYGMAEPVGRLPSVVGSHRYPAESSSSAHADHSSLWGMIPCMVDTKSGSSSQAEKRKANSDASRRFRNRKRNEVQMEQKITAQQEEMRKQAEILHRQTHDLRALFQEREYYRSERDFYREQLGRVIPPGQLPARPASPRALLSAVEKPTTDRGNESVWQHGTTAPLTSLPAPAGLPPASAAPVPATRPAGTWTTAPAAYSTAPSTSVMSEEQPARTLPQLSSWTR